MHVAAFQRGFRTSAAEDFEDDQEAFWAACDFGDEDADEISSPTLLAACTSYAEGGAAARALRRDLGRTAVKTAYNHRAEGLTCFIATAPPARAAAILRRPTNWSLFQVERFPHSHRVAPHLPRVIADRKLEGMTVHFAPGALRKHSRKSTALPEPLFLDTLARWKRRLRAATAAVGAKGSLADVIYWVASDLEDVRSRRRSSNAHSEKERRWNEALKTLNGLERADAEERGGRGRGGGGHGGDGGGIYEACGWQSLKYIHAQNDVLIIRGFDASLSLAAATSSSASPFAHSGGSSGSDSRGNEAAASNKATNSSGSGDDGDEAAAAIAAACAMGLLGFLSAQAEVLHVSPWSRPQMSNYVASGMVQGGAAGQYAVQDYGIDGTGQVVGTIDSGLDEFSCFFYDTSLGTVPRKSVAEAQDNGGFDLDYRKVVQYIKFGDSLDVWHGHGTHTAGTIAGDIYSSWGGNRCGSGTVETCWGECSSDAMCAADQFIAESSCTAAASDFAFQWPFYCDTFGCDAAASAAYSEPCLPDADALLPESVGVAPGAKIAFFDAEDSTTQSFEIPSDLSEALDLAYVAGARIHSNSWGVSDSACAYDTLSLTADEYMYDQDEMLLLFAAGNSGEDGPCTITAPGTSKNALAVGATGSGKTRLDPDGAAGLETVAYFSSLGPTYDYRFKPDLVAPGYFTLSAAASSTGVLRTCALTGLAGTSMATPAVAGAAALVRQYFIDNYYGDDVSALGLCGIGLHGDCSGEFSSPTSALVKAVLINSARDLADGRTAPNVYEGHGTVQLDAALPLGGTSLMLWAYEGSLASGGSKTFALDLRGMSGTAAAALQATLVWIDPPASVASGQQVLHDLDLLLLTSDCVLTYSNGLAGLESWNNVEKITVAADDLTPQKYTFIVQAGSFTDADTQAYALVISSPAPAIVRDPTTDTSFANGCAYTTTTLSPGDLDFGFPEKTCFSVTVGSGSEDGTAPAETTATGECCVYHPGSVGDGICDTGDYNTEACEWDGADCCPMTCNATTTLCGDQGYDCQDPDWADCAYRDYLDIGDGFCDYGISGNPDLNTKDCGYDAGDCCSDCCQPVLYAARGGLLSYSCGSAGYTHCIDSECTFGKSAAARAMPLAGAGAAVVWILRVLAVAVVAVGAR